MKFVMKYGPWIAAFFAVALLVYGIITVRNYQPPTEFSMATGAEGGAYHKYGLEYQRLLAEQGYTLHLVPTAGSKENLHLLDEGMVDIALVQTNTASDVDITNLSSLGSLFYEPLWVFYRPETGDDSIRRLSDLTGKDIAIGAEGGGTHDIALFVLKENGVTADNATLHALSNAEAAAALIDGELDVIFMIASTEAPAVRELLTAPNVEVLNTERSLAYQQRYNDISTITLGEGAIDLALNIPDEDKVLLTAVAAFVAPHHLSPDLARLMLTVAEEVHGPGGILEARDEFPSNKLVEIPMDATAEGYLERGPTGLDQVFPLWVASRLERLLFLLVPFLILLYPLFRSAPLAVGFFFRFRINLWYRNLRRIELNADNMGVAEIDEQILWLDELERDLAKRLAVPMMYLADVYLLRFQVNQVERRLVRRREMLTGIAPSDDEGEDLFAESAAPVDMFGDDAPSAARLDDEDSTGIASHPRSDSSSES